VNNTPSRGQNIRPAPTYRRRVRPIRHAWGCGERIPCPKHGTLGVYLPAERLGNGDVIAHDCGGTWRPHELMTA
jgi:hypothetical protein